MRRTAIAMAVLVALGAVVPAVGAQCNPGCFDVFDDPDEVDDVTGGGSGATDDGGDPGIDEAGSTGPVLP